MISKIVIIGNSHAHSFTGSRLSNFGKGQRSTKFLTSYSLGPVSAKSLLKLKWKIAEGFLKKIHDPNSTLVLLSLGENDCRWYIPEASDIFSMEFNQAAAENVAKEFLTDMFEVMERIQSLGFQIAGWGGHPTPFLPHDQEKVIYGPYNFRSKLTRQWEREVLNYCQTNKILFISPIDNLLDQFGLPDTSKYIDNWHLDPVWLSAYLIRSLVEAREIQRFSFAQYKIELITNNFRLLFLKIIRILKSIKTR